LGDDLLKMSYQAEASTFKSYTAVSANMVIFRQISIKTKAGLYFRLFKTEQAEIVAEYLVISNPELLTSECKTANKDDLGNPVNPGDTSGPELGPTPPPAPPISCEWVWETYSYRSVIVQPSDGLVPASTQKMDNVNGADVIVVQGVNHLEVGNHPEMTNKLNQIFNRPSNSVFHRSVR
jgi:hypothetical protein